MTVPLVIAAAFFMENFDSNVITTALPEIARSFEVTPIAASGGVTAYLVAIAVFIPASGWMADRFGARNVLRAAITLYCLAAVLCATSSSLAAFVAARALQGAAGAMLVPVGRLIVLRSLPRQDFVRAMTFVTIPALCGGVIGPPIGGFLATYASWRWIFAINMAIGVVGVILVTLLFAKDKPIARRPLDVVGLLGGGLALALVMLGVDSLARQPLGDPTPVMVAAGGLALLALVVWHWLRAPNPLTDLTLFRIPSFRHAVTGGVIFYGAAAGTAFLLPILFQTGFGLSAFQSGLLTFTLAIGAIAMKALAPRILRRFGFRATLVGNGMIALAMMLTMVFFAPATPFVAVGLVLMVFGLARSLQFAALNTICYADVPDQRASAATSLSDSLKQLCNGLGVASCAAIMHVGVSAGDGILGASDVRYALAFACVAALASILVLARLDADAGAELSRKQPVVTRGART